MNDFTMSHGWGGGGYVGFLFSVLLTYIQLFGPPALTEWNLKTTIQMTDWAITRM